MYCPNCKEEHQGKFCPECGTKLIDLPTAGDISLNISDNAAIVGGVNINRNETHNTTKYVTVERQKSDAELMQERKQLFLQRCQQVLCNGLLIEEEKRLLEAERVRLGIHTDEAGQLIETARRLSGIRVTTLGVRDAMTLKNIDRNIESCNVVVLGSQIARLSALARNYNVDEVLYRYYMLLAALRPKELIQVYEAAIADEYWQTFWVSIAYMKCGNMERAEEAIVKLNFFDEYPEDNTLLLSVVSAHYVSDKASVLDYASAIFPDLCSPLLLPFVKSLFLEFVSERAEEVAVEKEKCKFYTEYIISLESPEDRTARLRAEEEQRNSFAAKNFIINGITFTMVAVAGGTFNMGSNDRDAVDREKPVHSVTLSDYYIGETEVTQALWQAVMGCNPSIFEGSSNPVECVSYIDCIDFIDKLNNLFKDQLPTGRKFRLPTEAEWEFAARGGNKSKGYKYSGSNNLDAVAWYEGNSGNKAHPVKEKQPNELGLYDMNGNVYEWCSDWYKDDYYSYSPKTNPKGPFGTLTNRVLRGGCWLYNALNCSVTCRSSFDPCNRISSVGLRLAF